MFDRFTNLARRSIYFARYEASVLGSSQITTEHLLLGLLRESPVRIRLPEGAAEQIRRRIEEQVTQPVASIPTSVDMPLSQDAERALDYAGEESRSIDCDQILLGILRVETCTAAVLLQEFGVKYEGFRETVRGLQSPAPPPAGDPASPASRSAADLRRMQSTLINLEDTGGPRLKRSGWTRKEAVGHLIDWAATHQQWFARALTEPRLTVDGYPGDGWLSAQAYNDLPWLELLDLCCSLNRLLSHVIGRIPEEKLNMPCRIGIAEPILLLELVQRYVAHCEDITAQLLMRG